MATKLFLGTYGMNNNNNVSKKASSRLQLLRGIWKKFYCNLKSSTPKAMEKDYCTLIFIGS
jgi:hypothetical protein